jgi:hypothetical protein
VEGTAADLSIGYEGELSMDIEDDDWEGQYRRLLRFCAKERVDQLLDRLEREDSIKCKGSSSIKSRRARGSKAIRGSG